METRKKMNVKFIEIFNIKLMEFFEKIITMYPNNKDFKSMRSQLRFLISINKKNPSNYFNE